MFELKNIQYTYKADTPVSSPALSDINLTIQKGEAVGLIGHTGSGKSTLAQILAGLIVPTGGEITLDGEPMYIKNKFNRALRGKIALVFQYPEYQLFEETVLKDIAFGPKNLGLSEAAALEKAKEAARNIGVSEEYFDKSPLALSGGEKRRVAIAGILAMEPEILILDEPTAGLDPEGREELLEILKNLHRKSGNTMILISHSMEFVASFTNRLLVLRRGSLHMDATPAEIFAQPDRLAEAGLYAPPVYRLFHALGIKPMQDAFTPEDAAEVLLSMMKAGGDTSCK